MIPAFARAAIVAQVQPVELLSNVGISRDEFEQKSRNFALFTHNIFKITDQLNLTLGLRYTRRAQATGRRPAVEQPRLRLDPRRRSAGSRRLRRQARLSLQSRTSVAGTLTSLSAIPCVANLNTHDRRQLRGQQEESKLSGTALLSYQADRAAADLCVLFARL